MLKNYFITMVRNFYRHFGYTTINVAGLAVGLATAIFIFLWVSDELSYDGFHKNKETLYRVFHNSQYTDGSVETYVSTCAPLAEAIKSEIPEVEYAVRSDWGSEYLFEYKEKSFMEKGLWADRDFFKMFTFPIIKGNSTGLPEGNNIAISQSLASKYFPNEDPIGKVFRIAQKYDMNITAVFEDVPKNSSMKFDFVLPFDVYYKERDWLKHWGNSSNQTYVKLREGASVAGVNKKMDAIIKKNCKDCPVNPFLHLYKDYRLYSRFENGKVAGGRIEYVRAFSIVAIFILIIACINFMNLATARSATRSREVGVRKAIGAQRKGLILQFIGESLIISFVSLLVAITLVEIGLPLFNGLTGKNITLDYSDPLVMLGLLSITIIAGVLAGSYPAFFLSSFKPVTVLKSNSQSLVTGGGLRKSLVVFQFAISIVLICGSIIVNEQINFIRTKNLGFNRENVVTLNILGKLEKNVDAFKAEALQHPGVVAISAGQHNPFDVQNTTSDPVWPGKPEGEIIPFKAIVSDADFIPTMGFTILEGRNFMPTKADTNNYIVNEAAVRAMGLKNPVGSELEMWYGKGQIIGVIKDFHNEDFRGTIDPLIFVYYPENAWRLFVRLDGKNTEEALAHLKAVYKKFEPSYPFVYSFLDDQFDDLYKTEQTTGRLAVCFTVIAIFISCLGLFGLASFTAERRTKEIGVRKALGASVFDLVALLCKDFTKLILLALVVGCPIAFYLMSQFLEQYIYHTELSGWIFLITGVSILLIALVTVIFQSARAALANPVTSLRTE
jgi:putative ABC transport system permease protein